MAIAPIITKYAIKAAGAVGIGICAYDAHKKGARRAKTYSNQKKLEALDYYYNNSRNLPTGSYFNSKVKDKVLDLEYKNNFRRFINKPVGYVKGFTNMMVHDALPWALSVAALATKGVAAKVSGVALAGYSVYAFAKNILGVGVTKK